MVRNGRTGGCGGGHLLHWAQLPPITLFCAFFCYSDLWEMHLTTSPLDLNLPICGVALVMVTIFLKLPTPPGTLRDKLTRMDWMSVHFNIAAMVSLTHPREQRELPGYFLHHCCGHRHYLGRYSISVEFSSSFGAAHIGPCRSDWLFHL